MARADEDERSIPVGYSVGQDLSAMSLEELAKHVAILRAEIVRIEETMRAKQASALAADAVFKR